MNEKKFLVQQEIAPSTKAVTPPVEHKAATFFKLTATRKVTYMAVLIAVAIALKAYSIPISSSTRISFLYIPCYLAGAFFGPLFGFCTGIVGDIVGYYVKSGGMFNPIITLGNGLTGFIVGVVFLFKGKNNYLKLIIGCFISMIICSLGINTFGLAVMGSSEGNIWSRYVYYLLFYGAIPRIVFQPIVAAINIALSLGLYPVMRKLLKKTLNSGAEGNEKIFDLAKEQEKTD